MFCDQCGTMLVYGAQFCHKCGAPAGGNGNLQSFSGRAPGRPASQTQTQKPVRASAPAQTPKSAPAPKPALLSQPTAESLPRPLARERTQTAAPQRSAPASPAYSQPAALPPDYPSRPDPYEAQRQYEPRQSAYPAPYSAPYPAPYPPSGGYYPPGTHPYHRLGGFLMAFVVGNYICAVLTILALLLFDYSFFVILQYASYLPSGFRACCVFGMIGGSALLIASAVVEFLFANKIQRKNYNFLHFIQLSSVIMMILSALFYLIFLLWLKQYDNYGVLSGGKMIIRFISMVIGWVICLVVDSIYFSSSVRVRTYMGSDLYLRCSLFNKRSLSPIPADGSDKKPNSGSRGVYSHAEPRQWAGYGAGYY